MLVCSNYKMYLKSIMPTSFALNIFKDTFYVQQLLIRRLWHQAFSQSFYDERPTGAEVTFLLELGKKNCSIVVDATKTLPCETDSSSTSPLSSALTPEKNLTGFTSYRSGVESASSAPLYGICFCRPAKAAQSSLERVWAMVCQKQPQVGKE